MPQPGLEAKRRRCALHMAAVPLPLTAASGTSGDSRKAGFRASKRTGAPERSVKALAAVEPERVRVNRYQWKLIVVVVTR